MATKKKAAKTTNTSMIGKHVVIRSGQAGVFVGVLLAHGGDRVTLKDSTRLWYWKAAKLTDQVASCSELATYGVKLSECKPSVAVPLHEIGQVIEVIPMTSAAVATFK